MWRKRWNWFFCNINMNEWNYSLSVLITNRHVLNEDDIKQGKKK